MTGWIKIQREITHHWCASDPNFFAVWFRLVAEANYKNNKTIINGAPVTIKRGQLMFGLNAFSDRSGVSVSKLRRIIKILLGEGMIDRQNFSKYSIISITNYDKHQSDDKQNAGRPQADDKQTTTLKEGKEGKEGKEIEGAEKSAPKKSKRKNNVRTIKTEFKTIEGLPAEYLEYAEQADFTKDWIEIEFRKFYRYFDQKGYRRPGWLASWKNWIDNAIQRKPDNNGNRNGQSKPAANPFLVAAAKIIDDDLSI